MDKVAVLSGLAAWVGLGVIPVIWELNRDQSYRFRHSLLLAITALLGPIGLLLWLLSRAELDDD